MILGDVMHHPVQVTETDWGSRADTDAALATSTRKSLLASIKAECMTVIAVHFPHPGFGHVVREEGKRGWRGV